MRFDRWLETETALLRKENRLREIPLRMEKPELCFCSNDYLGLSQHEALKKAAASAAMMYGTGSGGSRLIAGTWEPHHALELALKGWYKKEAALVFSSGYHAGTGILPAVAREGVIFSDELNHASLVDGCRLSRAKVVVYRHQDMNHLESLMKQNPDAFPRWIVSDAIFSMEATRAPLADLVALKKKYDACLLLDEAHAVGVYGLEGNGLSEEFDLTEEVDLILGTFGKALGGFGAFVVGKRSLISWLVNAARSFIFTTSLPPAVASANQESVAIVSRMGAERILLKRRAVQARVFFRKLGFSVPGEDSPIIPLIVGDAEEALRFSEALLEEGIWIQAIRPPTVPEKKSRLRITLSLSHSEKDLEKLFEAFEKLRAGVN